MGYDIQVHRPDGPSALLENRSGASTDDQLAAVWVQSKRSPHTRRSYTRISSGFLEFLRRRGVDLRGCTVLDLHEWTASLMGKARTRKQQVNAIKSLFSFAHRTGYLVFNVGAALATPIVPNDLAQRLLGQEEIFKLFASASPRAEPVLRLLYYTGGRVSEVCRLQWQHVYKTEDSGAVVTLHGKGGKTRNVRLEPSQAKVFWVLRENAGGGTDEEAYVLATRTGKPLHPGEAANMVKRAARKGKVTIKVSPHWFRHAHASHALDAGAPLHLVQATLGHASLATTTGYAHARPGESSSRYLKV